MRYANAPSWKISIDEPQALVIALHIRDASGLLPDLTDPPVPRLDPSVSARGVMVDIKVNIAAASAQWAAWWATLIGAGHRPLLDLQPPDFETLASAPELQSLVRAGFHEAVRWSNVRHREHADMMIGSGGSPDLGELVRDIERDLDRAVGPFDLQITELPVSGKRAWELGPGHVLVTRSLLADPDNLADWLRPRVKALA